MEIIGHTANINKTSNALQHFLIANPCDTIEMDFRLTRDNVLVWTHDRLVNGKDVCRSEYKELGLLTLDDVLEILNGDIALLLHLKGVNGVKRKNFDKLLRTLEILKEYPFISEIESINPDLIKMFLSYQEEISYMDIGLIINLFTTYRYRNGRIGGLEKVDFVSLSSELWENKSKDGYKRYRKLFPSAREYAWTWEKIYQENDMRIKNYMAKGADGIITSDTPLVRALYR